MENRSVLGVIEKITDVKSKDIKWTKNGKEETATIYSIGLKIKQDNDEEIWCNAEGNSEQKVDEFLINSITKSKFIEGDRVNVFEEGKASGDKIFYKVKGITSLGGDSAVSVAKPEVPDGPVPIVEEKVEAQPGQPGFKPANTVPEPKIPSVDRRIVRQNSLTQANSYLSSFLKMVELGMIDKSGAEILTPEKVCDIAKKFEDWVFREV